MKKRLYTMFIVLQILVLFFMVSPVNADDTGFNSPSADDSCYSLANNEHNAYIQNDQYAIFTNSPFGDRQSYEEYDFDVELPLYAEIVGIEVKLDAYATGTPTDMDINVFKSHSSCSGGTAKNTGTLPTSDTDTYITLGGSSDLWGTTWSADEFYNANLSIYVEYNSVGFYAGLLDHIEIKVYYVYVQPDRPYYYVNQSGSNIELLYMRNSVNYHTGVFMSWTKGNNSDKTLVRMSQAGFPSTTTGTLVYNGTGLSIDYNGNLGSYGYYYFRAWGWNETYHSYSTGYQQNDYLTQDNVSITQNTNNVNSTSTHEYVYSKLTGYKDWSNSTGFGINNTMNLVNSTGTFEYIPSIGKYLSWVNVTGNDSGSSCSLQYLNFTDSNITVNITYWGCNSTNTSNYAVNETNWLDLIYGSVSFDNTQYAIFILLCLFFFFFTSGYRENKRSGGALMLFSGFVLISLEYATAYLLDNYYVIALMSPLAVLIILLGIRKLLYPAGKEKTKTEGQ